MNANAVERFAKAYATAKAAMREEYEPLVSGCRGREITLREPRGVVSGMYWVVDGSGDEIAICLNRLEAEMIAAALDLALDVVADLKATEVTA